MANIDSNKLHEKLKEHFGFEQFKGTQEMVIKSLLEKNDVFVIMPTGGGKSLCYQLPALLLIRQRLNILLLNMILLLKKIFYHI